MIEKSKGGRPRKYTEAQVLKGIAHVEARGEIADGATVKQAMHDELGVSPGIARDFVKLPFANSLRNDRKEHSMTANKTGRPTSYTETQVLKGIAIVEDGGGDPDRRQCQESHVRPPRRADWRQRAEP